MANCNNERPCPCKKENCPNHGVCCACVERHRDKLNNLPYCLFPGINGDRSLKAYYTKLKEEYEKQ